MTTTDSLIVIAGSALSLDRALAKLAAYRKRTVREYDLPGPGDPTALTASEVRRTRVVSSRISGIELEWFLDRASTAPWLPPGTDLADADPGVSGGVYDAMTALYSHFRLAAPRGVSDAKISKVLHIKHPALYPILDSRLARTYREASTAAALRHPERGFRSMKWAAIRADVIENRDSGAFSAVRGAIEESTSLSDFNRVTDLRLLDMLTW